MAGKQTIDSFTGKHTFLSNFHHEEIVWEGVSYPTLEHAYQASKTLIMEEREPIRLAKMPGEAKRIGRTVTMREGWSGLRLVVMEELLRLKFGDPTLGARLLGTGDAKLVEGNSWGDQFWGVCRGRGQSRLGLLLMKIREELVEGLVDPANIVTVGEPMLLEPDLHDRIETMNQGTLEGFE